MKNDESTSTTYDMAADAAVEELYFGRKRRPDREILILGGGGYLGSVLTWLLLENRYSVTVLDQFLYGSGSLDRVKNRECLKIFTGDVRDEELCTELLRGKDTVVNLAAIVGDEACRLNEDATWEINVESIRSVARTARRAGVSRIIHASTCSTYGKNGDGLLSEHSPVTPLSLYAQSKVESENALLRETNGGTDPPCCILRFSTLFGYSRRPRFDLVVNTLTGHAWKNGHITIFGGNQWRPLLHVGDAARAIKTAIEAPAEKIAGCIYNTGGENLNATILEIGRTIKNILPDTRMDVCREATDQRDYRVDFSKIRRELGFIPEHDVSNGVLELLHVFENDSTVDPEQPEYSNFKWLDRNSQLLQSWMLHT
jgi:nucleoside-diphosphate-sugar epimerase